MSEFRRRMMMVGGIDYSQYAIHKAINPEVMAIVYAQGWSASPDYMTFEEAAAVTNSQIFDVFDGNQNITHFEEFKYFTGVTCIGASDGQMNKGFYNCTKLSVIELPNTITRLSFGCFKYSGITSIYIPDSVGTINQGRSNWKHNTSPFHGCTKLVSVRYTGGTTTMVGQLFYGCTKLKTITNIDHITRIGGGAFHGCTSLTDFTIPSGVTDLGGSIASTASSYTGNVFYNCTALQNITCLPTTPPTLTGTNNFYNTTCTISVPAESLNTYKNAAGWSDVADRIIAIS